MDLPERQPRRPSADDGRKVVIADTDHLCGICGNRVWAWKAFTRGQHPIFLDGYDGAAFGSGGAAFEMQHPTCMSLRENLGHIRGLADDLADDGRLAPLTPMTEVCSAGYRLDGGDAAAYTVVDFIPNGRTVEVDLTHAAPLGGSTRSSGWTPPTANGVTRRR